jgi:hypothetical protein
MNTIVFNKVMCTLHNKNVILKKKIKKALQNANNACNNNNIEYLKIWNNVDNLTIQYLNQNHNSIESVTTIEKLYTENQIDM